MRYKKFGQVFILCFERGEEVLTAFRNFLKEQNVRAGFFTGLGAVNKAEVGLYDVENKQYVTKSFHGDYEVASLVGNVSIMNDEIIVHSHVVISDKDMNAFGGASEQGFGLGHSGDPSDGSWQRAGKKKGCGAGAEPAGRVKEFWVVISLCSIRLLRFYFTFFINVFLE